MNLKQLREETAVLAAQADNLKSVLMSIKPKYCELIATGKKTIEVRKTKPKIKTPFKCYIYCTKGEYSIYGNDKHCVTDYLNFLNSDSSKEGLKKVAGLSKWNGKVIGEFICDRITGGFLISPWSDYIQKKSCLTYSEIEKYAGDKPVWSWHISNLVIYDEPKELSEFYTLCSEYEREHITSKCGRCRHISFNEFDRCLECDCKGEKKLTRPPQSWCYVEV